MKMFVKDHGFHTKQFIRSLGAFWRCGMALMSKLCTCRRVRASPHGSRNGEHRTGNREGKGIPPTAPHRIPPTHSTNPGAPPRTPRAPKGSQGNHPSPKHPAPDTLPQTPSPKHPAPNTAPNTHCACKLTQWLPRVPKGAPKRAPEGPEESPHWDPNGHPPGGFQIPRKGARRGCLRGFPLPHACPTRPSLYRIHCRDHDVIMR